MKLLLTVLVSLLALALGPADAQAQSPAAAAAWAFSDSRTLPPADDPPFELTQAAYQHCPPPAGGSVAPPPDLENLDKLIAMFQEQLRALAADDPQRATFQASLKALQDARESARAAPAAPPPPAPATTPAKPLTFEQALSTVRTTLEAQAGRPAMAALAASPEGKDPRRASLAAVAAVAARNPGGALAALLAAHARAPEDPAHLVNAAAILNALGRPAEALAFLDRAATLGDYAAPPGMNGRAVLLNNRGHALLALKRFADAEKVLAQAVALEPRLSEAKANLAGALLCQKKEKEAVRSFLASTWRTPAKQVVCDEADVQKGKVCGGRSRSRKSAAETFDLSAGTEGKLPAIPYPEKADNAGRDLPMFATWKQSLVDQSLGLSKQLADNQMKLNERASSGGSRRGGAALSRRRFEQAMSFLASTRHESGVSGLVDAFESTSKALANYPTEIGLNALAANLADRSCGGRQSHIKGLHRKWAGLFAAHDKATRALFREEHRLKTGVASNLGGVLHHERATLEIENYTNLTLLGLVGHVEEWILFASRYHDCTQVAPVDALDHPEANNEKAPPCPPFVAGAKFTIKLGILNLQVNCEQVEVEASGPSWLTAFGSVGYKFAPPGTLNQWSRAFDGELTVGAGVKATAGPSAFAPATPSAPSPLAPFEVSAKGGAYATFNGDGDCVDLGLIGEVSGAAGGAFGVELGGDAGGIGGPVSLASAFAGP